MSQAGQNLKYLRKLRGWTQEEFAVKLGIKRSLIGAYEEERADPRLEVLEVVCDIFKLTLDELLLKDLSNTASTYLAKRRQQKMLTAERNVIHFVPVKAAAGYLAIHLPYRCWPVAITGHLKLLVTVCCPPQVAVLL
jgi:transcriptional regulator with XRE-family HTH domain